jgi:hypothetical protein
MENKISTAQELLKNNFLLIENDRTCEAYTHLVVEQMIAFTKLHVEAALQYAAENAEAIEGWNTGFSGSAASVDKASILNSYPLDKIK